MNEWKEKKVEKGEVRLQWECKCGTGGSAGYLNKSEKEGCMNEHT